jgi:hypothetical protein
MVWEENLTSASVRLGEFILLKEVSANERNHMKNFDRLNFDESFVIIVTRHSNLFQSQIFLLKFIFF